MTDKELKKLSRTELLTMLLSVSKENAELRQELEQAQQALSDRKIAVEESGSLAEAALKLNGVFEAAQAACRQYTENIRRCSENAESRCAEMESRTKERCRLMLADAQKRVDDYLIREAKRLIDGNNGTDGE